MSQIFKRQEEKLLRFLVGEKGQRIYLVVPPSSNLELIKGAVMETLKTKHSLNYLTSGTGNTSFDLQGLSRTKARGNIRLLFIHTLNKICQTILAEVMLMYVSIVQCIVKWEHSVCFIQFFIVPLGRHNSLYFAKQASIRNLWKKE